MMPWNGCSKSSWGSSQKMAIHVFDPLPVLAAHHCWCDSECEDDGYQTTNGELKDDQRVWGTVKVGN